MKLVEGFIESIAFGGDGILKHDNKVIFVPFSAPNELVRANIIQDKASFAKASLLQVIKPSLERIIPQCIYFTECGGCQLQHISYTKQLDIKRSFVKDALMRIGKIDMEVLNTIESLEQLFYRKHIKLKIQNSQIGYVRHSLKGIVSIKKCLIFDSDISTIINDLNLLINLFIGIDELHIFQENQNSYVIYANSYKKFNKELGNLIIKQISSIKGVIIKHNNNYKHYGDCELNTVVDNIKLVYSPLVFMQANKKQSQNIIYKILELAALNNCKNIIDLYCGIGVSSLFLRKAGYNVIAIELNNYAILSAQKNALINNINGISWHAMDAENFTSLDLSNFDTDTIIINPPRIGVSKTLISKLLSLKVKNIFYISCMPSTLARDIKELKNDYDVIYCQPFDMFPQTTHVETLVYLRLNYD